jgi:hypothetical protein
MWNNEDSHVQLLDSKYTQQPQDITKRDYMQKNPAIHPAYTRTATNNAIRHDFSSAVP